MTTTATRPAPPSSAPRTERFLHSAPMAPPRTFSQRPYVGPPGSTELLLVRHGASADSVEGEAFELVEGQGDPPLSEAGRHQAELVARRLGTEPFDGMYVSTLRRTAETAAPLVERSGITPVVDADLREVFLGEWEGGLLRQRVVDQDPLFDRVMQEQRWDVIPGAESRQAFGGRLRRAVERIADAHPGGRVVVFSHGAAIGEMLAQAADSAPFAFVGADNASISRIVVAPERWLVRGYNDTAHLAG
jgi:2,3-bisphosphoglycerate-dependent phosphoglycerate mutase